MKKIFEGVGVAIVTPFENGLVDFVSFENLLRDVLDKGANAVIVLGTTGESVAITEIERKEIISTARLIIGDKAKLIVGTGSNNFDLAQKYTEMAKTLGADASLVVTPYYNKTTEQGLIKYYNSLAEIGSPIIMYNVPSRTGVNISLDVVRRLIDNPNIVGIKEATSDINRILVLLSLCKDKVAVYSGEDALNYVFYTLGADGCISVTANAYTKEVKNIFDLVKTRNIYQGLKEQRRLQEIDKVLFCETNPIPIKYMLYKKDKIKSYETRMPLVEPTEQHKKDIEKACIDYENWNNIT